MLFRRKSLFQALFGTPTPCVRTRLIGLSPRAATFHSLLLGDFEATSFGMEACRTGIAGSLSQFIVPVNEWLSWYNSKHESSTPACSSTIMSFSFPASSGGLECSSSVPLSLLCMGVRDLVFEVAVA
jgi:hypothetical protein